MALKRKTADVDKVSMGLLLERVSRRHIPALTKSKSGAKWNNAECKCP